VLHLFTNNITPSESTTLLGTPITECTTPGYVPITLVPAGWTTTQNLGITAGVYSQQTFNLNTGVDVYGYYMTNTANQLLWVERFSGAPFTLPAGGGQIQITSKVTLD
jgi:hypothetical protein